MKKTVERLAFMLLGAILVSAAYYVGSTDSTADAKLTTYDNLRVKGDLHVEGSVFVGRMQEPTNMVQITVGERASTIRLYHNRLDPMHEDASLILTTATPEGGEPVSALELSDKFGNNLIVSSAAGIHHLKP